MKRRQTVPRQWLIADTRMGDGLWTAIRKLPRASGVLVLYRDMPRRDRARLIARIRRLTARRAITLADEFARGAVRVHDMREMRRAGLQRAPLIFLSPIFPTRSHPEWPPLPRMQAAALVRLARVPVIALGGMDARRFARVRALDFQGWAGIGAFRT